MHPSDADATQTAVVAPDVEAAPGPVLDAETALLIGLRAIQEQFAPDIVQRHRPYEAVLVHKEWLVVGNPDPDGEAAKRQASLPPGTFISIRGGAPGATISREDGRVLSVSFGR